MSLQTTGRIISFVIGAATILIFQFALGYPAYVVIPAAVISYTASRLIFALIGSRKSSSK